jgi:phage terminase large subunit-like protein
MNFLIKIHRVTEYAHAVVDGREVAGPHVRASCRRHLADLLRDDLYFDTAAADRALSFFETVLTLSEGQFDGKPFLLHPSQAFIIGSLFGWMKRHGDCRRFRRCYAEEGKGNGKSPLAAGIGLYGLLADGEPGAQVYSAASTKDQANILFQDAVKMAERNKRISQRVIFSGKKVVTNMAVGAGRQYGSFFRPVSGATGRHGSGPRPHIALIDELHEHPSRDVLDILERGFKFRRQPLMVMLTNSGTDRKSVCWEERQHAIDAANGNAGCDDTFSYVCALDEGDDPFEDESCWKKVNPLLGVILSYDYLRGVVSQAAAIPGRRNNILRLHFCVWTDAVTAWITRETWDSLADPDLDISDFRDKPCVVGLDLSSRKDFTAAVAAFIDGEVIDQDTGERKKTYALFPFIYTPADTMAEREKADRAPYSAWFDEGFIITVPGSVVRFPFVIKDLVALQQYHDLIALVYDKYLMTRFEEDMIDAGAEFPLVEHSQGWRKRVDNPLWMPGSVDAFEDVVLERRVRFAPNAAFSASAAGATFLTSPAGLKRFDKARATTRIDPIIAAVQAIGYWELARTDEEHGESIYEQLARVSEHIEEPQTIIFEDPDDDDDW